MKEMSIKATDEQDKKNVKQLSDAFLTMSTENALLKAQNSGFKEALINERKRRKRGNGLFEELRAQDGQGATFFSPAKIQATKDLQTQREHTKQEQKKQKDAQKAAKKVDRQLRQEAAAATAIARKEVVTAKVHQKQLDKETRKADKQLQQQLQASTNRPKSVRKHANTPVLSTSVSGESSKAKDQELTASRSGRIPRKPQHLT